MTWLRPSYLVLSLLAAGQMAGAQVTPYRSSEEFAKYAMKLRESALSQIEPRISIPTTARTNSAGGVYQWKQDIITTTFWVGENSSVNNPVHNRASSWDLNWATNYGGYDTPDVDGRLAAGQDYRPKAFIPRLNPFYYALPYNDVTMGTTKPEARTCIPWFRNAFVRPGLTVLKDRWIAVRNRRNGRISYAQWGDCGPFRTDHWQYVFGNERPKANLNGGAGLDVSPSVRDYLGIAPTDVVDWRFVEAREVPPGPWRKYGENNPFVQQARQDNMVKNAPSNEKAAPQAAPRVMIR
ncbi:MAG: hypothetical protein ABMA13_23270 [Chthoniobacteraceae bacterium]